MSSSYGQFCPIALACEVVAERWTPLILRELLAGSRRFNDLRRGLPLISPSLLSKRLKSLERAGVVVHEGGEWVATEAGQELRPMLEALGHWGQRWVSGALEPDRLDARLLMWDMRRRIDTERVPHRVVLQAEIRGSIGPSSRFWLVIDGNDVDLCIIDPGFDPDLVLRAEVRDLVAYWRGEAELEELTAAGAVQVSGPQHLVRQLPSWLLRSPFAEVELAPAE